MSSRLSEANGEIFYRITLSKDLSTAVLRTFGRDDRKGLRLRLFAWAKELRHHNPLTQDIFLKIWQSRHKISSILIRDLDSYIFRIRYINEAVEESSGREPA